MRESSNPTRKRGPDGEELEYPCRGCGEKFFGPKARGSHERNAYCRKKIRDAKAASASVRIRTCYQIAAAEVEVAFVAEDVSRIETARRLVRAHLGLTAEAALCCTVFDQSPRRELHYYEVSEKEPVWA